MKPSRFLIVAAFLLGGCSPFPGESSSSSHAQESLPGSESSSEGGSGASSAGSEEAQILTSTIVFGTGQYDEGDVPSMDSFSQGGEGIVTSIAAEKSFASDRGDNTALRLGSSGSAGQINFSLDDSYVLSSIDVYGYKYKNDDAKIGLLLNGDEAASPVAVSFESAPVIGEHSPSSRIAFSSLEEKGEASSFGFYNEAGKQRVLIVEIVISFYESGAPSGGGTVSSSSQSQSSSEESVSSSQSQGGNLPSGSLEEEYESLSSSVRSYYEDVDLSKEGASLKTDFSKCIKSHTNVGYDGLWDVYEDSDDDGNGNYWDMYSDIRHRLGTGTGGNYSKEGDVMNREHVVPQSVFNEKSPMKSDAHQVIPTDGYVNNRRSNYPFAEVGSATYTSKNGSKVGKSSTPGYSGTAFEPVDEYKGDIARINFYFVTCYESEMASGWKSYAMFNYSSSLRLSSWAVDMLLKWAEEDPVSQKEIDRNNGVYKHQKNRNPFVDFPSLAEAIFA